MTKSGFDLDEIERLLAAATVGPWPWAYTGDGKRITVGEGLVDGPNGYEVAEVYSDDCDSAEAEANAALIVAARNSLPAMLTEIRELRAENARLKEAVVDLADNIDDWDGVSGITEAVIDTARAALGEPQ